MQLGGMHTGQYSQSMRKRQQTAAQQTAAVAATAPVPHPRVGSSAAASRGSKTSSAAAITEALRTSIQPRHGSKHAAMLGKQQHGCITCHKTQHPPPLTPAAALLPPERPQAPQSPVSSEAVTCCLYCNMVIVMSLQATCCVQQGQPERTAPQSVRSVSEEPSLRAAWRGSARRAQAHAQLRGREPHQLSSAVSNTGC